MLWSIRTRLAFIAIILVLLTAGSLMWFAHKDTITALRQSERRTLNNVMFLLEHDLSVAHTQALHAKVRAVESVKAGLEKAAAAAAAAMDAARAALGDDAGKSLEIWTASLVDPQMRVRFFLRHGDGAWRETGTNLPSPPETAGLFTALGPGEGEFILDSSGRDLVRVTRHGPAGILVSRSLASLEESSRSGVEATGERFKELLAHVAVQETGFAAVLDASGNLVAGPKHTHIPEKLKSTLAAGVFSGVSRRVMVLPASDEKNAPEVLYILGFFRPLRWHILLAAPLEELEAPAVSLVAGQMWITLAVTAVGLVVGLLLAAHITGPVRRLTQVVRSLPEKDILTLDIGGLDKELPGGRKDEVGELARSFGRMAGELHANVVRLVESTTARERIESELQVARDIQYGILPGDFAGDARVDLAASMITARAVGGDLYDFFFLDADRLCLVIGDVSDKSVPAALFMSMTVSVLRATMRDGAIPPEEAMARINETLARDNPRNMFVTLVIAILDTRTGRLEWASAGHMPPVLITRDGARGLEVSGDMMAGVFDGTVYKRLWFNLAPGDALFLYTDGVSEAMNKKLELFGEERLIRCLSALNSAPAEEITHGVYAAVREHAAGEEQSDDIAVMAVRFHGP